jgi:hypothetical protein
MITKRQISIAMLAAAMWACAVSAQTNATFDFDTGIPVLLPGQNVPINQIADGLTANFSSPQGMAFSIQSNATTFYVLSQFSGRYIWPNNLTRNVLVVEFGQPLTAIGLTFATIEYHDPGLTPTPIQLTAYADAAGTVPVGSVTAHGTEIPGQSYPQGTLSFASAQPFCRVEIVVTDIKDGATGCVIDNITVTMPCRVDLADFAVFASHWNEFDCGLTGNCGGADLNQDDVVDEFDLAIFVSNWLSDCPANWPWP